MTENDERELRERLAEIAAIVKSTELALDGACRTGELKSTRQFAFLLMQSSGIFLEVIDMILEGK